MSKFVGSRLDVLFSSDENTLSLEKYDKKMLFGPETEFEKRLLCER